MIVVKRASIADVLGYLVAQIRPTPAAEYRLLVAEALSGNVLAAFSDANSPGVPVALGGFYRIDGSPDLAWFSVRPGVPRLVSLVRAMRAEMDGREAVSAYVRDDNAAGRRLARLLGFTAGERTVGLLREWRLERSGRQPDGQDGEAPGADGTPGAAGTAAAAR